MFDVAKLTLDEVGEEIDRAIAKLQRLQALYAAMQEQDHNRVAKLIQEYNRLKAEEVTKSTNPPSDPPAPTVES